jgi:hypothetical protein
MVKKMETTIAVLDEKVLKQIQELEKQLGITLIAYETKK